MSNFNTNILSDEMSDADTGEAKSQCEENAMQLKPTNVARSVKL